MSFLSKVRNIIFGEERPSPVPSPQTPKPNVQPKREEVVLYPGEVLIEFKPRTDNRRPQKIKFKAADLEQEFLEAHKKFVSQPREYDVLTGIVADQSGHATVIFKGLISRNVNYWSCQFFFTTDWRPANGFQTDCYLPM